MKAELLHSTPLMNCIIATRTCYDSMDKSDTTEHTKGRYHYYPIYLGKKDKALLRRVIGAGHESVIEHAVYTFHIKGVSRALLQELARHRIASISVRSTRYTLKKWLKDDDHLEEFVHPCPELFDLNQKYIRDMIEIVKDNNLKPDQFKHYVTENLLTEVIWTINARSLRNFLKLRSSPAAMWEIRELAKWIWEEIPYEHKETLFYDIEV